MSVEPHARLPAADVPGVVIWITGLSGAGKTSIALRTLARLRAELPNVVMLDGDVVRETMGGDLDHSEAGRLANAYRVSRLSASLASQGVHVVCATMSLFPEIWSFNRARMARYFEVYVRVPLPTLVARDARGLYSRAQRGEARHVVGVDLPFTEPAGAHLVLDNDGPTSDLDALAQRIVVASGCLDGRDAGSKDRRAPSSGRRRPRRS